MSNELYPSNSTIIDLRHKISAQTTSKTKQFLNELDRLTGTPSFQKDTEPNRTYEHERWLSPKPDHMNMSLPPRRSIFTPSRLQNISAQRTRDARKPYWRCPWPTSKTPTSTNFTDIERSIHNELLSSTSIADEKHANKPPTVTVTPAPMKSFVRRREPETGGKTNVFNIDEEELAENDYTSNKETMEELTKIAQPVVFVPPKAGFLTASESMHSVNDDAQDAPDDLVFAFSEPEDRQPKCPTPPPKKAISIETGIQTEEKNVEDVVTIMGNKTTSQDQVVQQSAANFSSNFFVKLKFLKDFGEIFAPKLNASTVTTTSTEAQPIESGAPKINGANNIESMNGSISSIPVLTSATSAVPLFGIPMNGLSKIGDANKQDSLVIPPVTSTSISANGFQFGPPVNGGSFQFGPPGLSNATSTNDAIMTNKIVGATIPSLAEKLPTSETNANTPDFSGFSGFQFGPLGAPPVGGTFQFGAPPANGTAFQFSGSTTTTSDVGSMDGGLGTRSGISARKLLQARRTKKR